jgi:hypothetical protein
MRSRRQRLANGSVIISNMDASSDPIDRYFTEQVVGPAIIVAMGPAAGARRTPSRGVLIDGVNHQVELFGVGARSFLAPEPWRALAGTPVAMPEMRSLRRSVLMVALLAWSLALWLVFLWWAR